jgi:hypothetical protein
MTGRSSDKVHPNVRIMDRCSGVATGVNNRAYLDTAAIQEPRRAARKRLMAKK